MKVFVALWFLLISLVLTIFFPSSINIQYREEDLLSELKLSTSVNSQIMEEEAEMDTSVGRRYALVFYGELTSYMARVVEERGYAIAILDVASTPSPPKQLKDGGTTPLGYLDILGIPSSSYTWAKENYPEWILYTTNGEPAKYWYGENVMCNIAIKSFREYLINKTMTIVNNGYEGVFLDDVVIEPSMLGGPLYDCPVYDESEYGPWINHLVELFREIKNETDAVVVYNAGWDLPNEKLMKEADGVMLESHPGSWSGNVNSPSYYLRDWNTIYNISVAAQRYAKEGKIVIALNYGGDEKTEFYTYAAVRLFDFYYWYSTPDLASISEARVLKIDLGDPLTGHKKVRNVYFRVYSKGIVILNPSIESSDISLGVPQNVTKLTDIRSGKVYEKKDGNLTLEIGPQEGIVLLYGEIDVKGDSSLYFLAGSVITVAIFLALLFLKRKGVL